MRFTKETKHNIAIIILFILLTIIMTFPLAFKINTYIPGFFSTDEPYSSLWYFWVIKHSFINKIPLGQTSLVAYPFGIDLYPSSFFSYLSQGLNHLLAIVTLPEFTWNVQVLLNLFLSGVFTYLLSFYLVKNRLAAIFSGITFAFCPYQFMRAWQHLGLTYNQWIPLSLLAAILLRENFSKKTAVLFFVSLVLLTFDFNIIYFAAVTLLSFFFYLLLKRKKDVLGEVRYFRRVLIIMILAFVILIPQFFPILKNLSDTFRTAPSVFNLYRRPFEDLFMQSARPLGYLLPAVVHPLFGKFTEQFIASPLYGISFSEHTLYLGWTALILAFMAFRSWRKAKKIKLDEREKFYVGFFLFLAIVAWFFSQPPWWKIGPVKIFMPSFFMYKILPMFRAYCRFGIVVMLAIAVLAGFGIKFILEKFKTEKTKIAITTLFCGLVLFEFWNWPPYKVIDVSKVPAVYYWLKEQPGEFVIAEYPLDTAGPSEMYKLYQTRHEKKIINATVPETHAYKVAKTITELSDPNTAKVLKWMNVKYVLVHKEDYLKTELIEDKKELNKISYNSGLKFIKTFPPQECHRKDIMCVQKTGPIDVYEVIAYPVSPEIKE